MARDENGVPVWRGRAKNLTLDLAAVEVLEAIASGPRAQGWLVSALLLAEGARREERARLKHALLAALGEPGGIDDD
jgi:hypothetical protein